MRQPRTTTDHTPTFLGTHLPIGRRFHCARTPSRIERLGVGAGALPPRRDPISISKFTPALRCWPKTKSNSGGDTSAMFTPPPCPRDWDFAFNAITLLEAVVLICDLHPKRGSDRQGNTRLLLSTGATWRRGINFFALRRGYITRTRYPVSGAQAFRKYSFTSTFIS